MGRLVGYGVSQVPTNGMLGGMAYQDPINVTVNNISVGGGTLTGIASQPLQVTGGAYVSGSVGIGITNPSTKVHILSTGNGSSGSTGLSDSSIASSLLLQPTSGSGTALALGARNTGGHYIQGLYTANPVVSVRDVQINPYGGSVGIGTFADAFGGAPGSSTFVVATTGVERMRIDSGGDVSIVTGNLIIGIAGKGIDFSADGNAAGMTSELLDDYEEGTWTPSLGGTTTYNFRVGIYTKIGRQVTISFDISVNLIGTGSSTTITGAPFSTGASGEGYGVTAYFDSLNVNVIALNVTIANNTSLISFTSMNASGASVTTGTSVFKNSTRIQGSITYLAT